MTVKIDKLGYVWAVLSVTTVGTLMAVMQSSALLISLPGIMGSLHMGLFTVMWVLLVCMFITTAMVPLFGRLADMLGRKDLYVLGFGVFTLGSLLCAFTILLFFIVSLIALAISLIRVRPASAATAHEGTNEQVEDSSL